MNRLPLHSAILACVLSVCAMAGSSRGQAVQAPLQFAPPKGWQRLPVMPHEAHQVARWIDPEAKVHEYAFLGGAKARESTNDVLDVLVFSKAGNPSAIESSHPGYLALMERELPGLSFLPGSVQEHGGFECTSLEAVLYEDAVGQPRRWLLVRLCRQDDLEVVLQMRCSPATRADAEAALVAVAKSLKPAGAGKSAPPWAAPRPAILWRDMAGLDVVESAKLMAEQSQAIKAWTKASLPPGWKATEEGGVLLLHADKSAEAKDLGRDMAAWRAWLEARFGDHVARKAARTTVLTVYPGLEYEQSRRDDANAQDLRRLRQGMPFSIVGCEDHKSQGNWSHSIAGRGVLEAWFEDRDPDLRRVLPTWLEKGLNSLAAAARAKGGVSFDPTTWERRGIQFASAKDRILSARDILTKPYPSAGQGPLSSDQVAELECHAAQLLRTLSGPAARAHEPSSRLLDRLLWCLARQVERERPAVDEALAKANLAPDATDWDRALERRRHWIGRAQEMQRKAVEEALADWTARDWEALERLHRAAY